MLQERLQPAPGWEQESDTVPQDWDTTLAFSLSRVFLATLCLQSNVQSSPPALLAPQGDPNLPPHSQGSMQSSGTEAECCKRAYMQTGPKNSALGHGLGCDFRCLRCSWSAWLVISHQKGTCSPAAPCVLHRRALSFRQGAVSRAHPLSSHCLPHLACPAWMRFLCMLFLRPLLGSGCVFVFSPPRSLFHSLPGIIRGLLKGCC